MKCAVLAVDDIARRRAPQGVRGLKFDTVLCFGKLVFVAPRKGRVD